VISQEPAVARPATAGPAPASAAAELLRGALAPVICAAVLLGLLSVWVATGGAGTIKHVSIDITSASISLPASPGGPAVGYLSVVNNGAADRLVSVSTPDARGVLFVERDGRIAGPGRTLRGIPIPAHATLNLNPFATDIVLLGPSSSMTPGHTVPLTLTFSAAGKITVEADITPPGTP
jgi:periplasmic copper chaperone A